LLAIKGVDCTSGKQDSTKVGAYFWECNETPATSSNLSILPALSLFPVTKDVMCYICPISGKNVTLSHTTIFTLTCDVFCYILPEKRHILDPLVQNFFEREEM